jgi:predicted nuclease with TOPRIM domain
LPLTDEEIRERVIRHDFQFEALSDSLKSAVRELHELAESLKSVAVINEKIGHIDENLRESFQRVHSRTDKLEKDVDEAKDCCNEVATLNRTVFGKDGRGGLLFDVEDLKMFMYKAMGAFTVFNILIGIVIAFLTK